MTCNNERKEGDMRAADAVATLLDQRLYPRLCKYWRWGKYERIYDLEKQYVGIDVTLTKKDGSVINIDEKAQVYYINRNLPTFAFELSYIDSKGKRKDGWFIDRKNKTDYYLLIYPYATNTDVSTLKTDEITKLECYVLSKKRLKSYLYKNGFDMKNLVQTANDLRKEHKYGKTETECPEVSFYYSSPEKYREEPINVVLRKTVLRELSDRYYIVENKTSA